MSDADFTGYIAFQPLGSDAEVLSLKSGPHLGPIREWLEGGDDEATAPSINISEDDQGEQKVDADDREVPQVISRFRADISKYYNLNAYSNFIMPMIAGLHVKNNLEATAISEYKVVESVNGKNIYGFRQDQQKQLISGLKRTKALTHGFDALPGAVLLSLVATFDAHVADVMRIIFKKTPDRFKTAERKIAVSEIFDVDDFDELMSKIIEDEIDSVMRGSHDEQVRYIEKNVNVSIIKGYENYPSFLEIFERRNIVAHGANIVNRTYLRNCKKYGVDVSAINVGDELLLNAGYLSKSTDIILEFGLKLMLSVWRKNFDVKDDELASAINSAAFDLIQSKHSWVAELILNFGLVEQNLKCSDRIRRMMIVNRANALRLTDRTEEANALLDDTDWSASSPEFQICVAAVKGDAKRVSEIMPVAVSSGALGADELRDWPVFNEVKKTDEFRDAFLAATGEALDADVTAIEERAAPPEMEQMGG